MAPTSTLTMLKRQSQSNCYIDYDGNEQCGGWSYGAKFGVGIAIAAGIAALFLVLSIMGRRKRLRQAANVTPAFTTTTPIQPYQVQTENDQWNTTYGGQSGGQAYYPPTPQHKNSYFAPPPGPPPEEDVPYYPGVPSMPPPSYQHREGKV